MLLLESRGALRLKTLFDTTTVADRFLFLILCILSVAGLFFMREVLPSRETVEIDVNGKPAYVFSLDEDRIIQVQGSLGQTTVEIRARRVRIVDSPCPNKLCISQGWIRTGSVICLPNNVAVTIGGHADRESGLDAITR